MRGRHLLVAAAIALAAAGCRRAPEKTCDGAQPVVDQGLVAFLSLAKAAHHEADVFEEDDKPAEAIGALERITNAKEIPDAPEVREVLADTRARLAELRVPGGDFDGAERDVDAGKKLATEPSYFRGHLFEVEGLVEAKRASALAKAGNAADAEKARARSIAASDEATKILFDVVHQAMEKKKP